MVRCEGVVAGAGVEDPPWAGALCAAPPEPAVEGAAAVPCSPVLADVEGVCSSVAGGFWAGFFGLVPDLRVGVVCASAAEAERVSAAARKSERSIRFTPVQRKGRGRVARAARRGQGDETFANPSRAR